MDLNALMKMVSALKSDEGNVSNFQANPVAFIEKFLGVDLPDDQVNALIAGVSNNFLKGNTANAMGNGGGSDMIGAVLGGLLGGGERANANSVDKSGVDFTALIGKLAVAKFDTNGDGKIDMNDLGGILGNIIGGGNKAGFGADNGGETGLDLGTLMKMFKV
ncbi:MULTISPECIES: hypothetical protein [unclassified Campylobacter]|uniref:hypothetical protein n=1 Tax=unclassified Campylobacter TaxID=2593542 RepID=UPI0022E9F3F4|nr:MULTISPECIES: hypothetical protein [unclassified Campylobacter]MDA3043306.1 hypothetical protein [Campylobacter sp. JMF_09 ED2]MDA3045005.1 hypothetical protein [Campylobacter sp. JMF_07 ED4]MDA3064395.1 hypothetical protein [Campylobacter sp. JMF_11 EL3]MDA3071788.1 hypothetical protein [Campylobacter sp. VBCF_03 NA9]MDA3075279.1 hypothetical protein [Campylobacter sp. JMF_05 ED3]